MQQVRCPSCRRRSIAHVERAVRGMRSVTMFSCAACGHSWKPSAATLERIKQRAARLPAAHR
jgi:hypothetical protein